MSKIHRFVMFVTALCLAVLTACTDELADNGAKNNLSTQVPPMKVENPGGLIQQADGTWKTQNCRVPIVGPGRVINEIYAPTISAISLKNDLTPIVDTNIDNTASLPVAVGADVGDQPIISVKDLYHIYATGQKVGFVYRDTKEHGGNLLTLDVLKSLTLTTFLKGKEQEKIRTGKEESNVLNLDVLTINAGESSDRVIAMDATKPFDEIRLSLTGISADVAATLAIKYAFVGENPEIRATSEEQFKGYWSANPPSINSKYSFTDITKNNANKIVDSDITDNYGDINSGVLGIIAASHRATVNFNKLIPAGTEIGVNYSGGSVLNVDLLKDGKHPHLTTYDANNDKVEEMRLGISVLRVGLLTSAKHAFINMRTTKPCSQLKIVRPTGGLLGLLDITNLHVYYAYIREAVKTDPANYFTFGDDSTYNYVYTLPKPQEGTVEYVLLAQPYGSDAKIENGKLVGLMKDGAYRVQALYTASDGRQVSHIGTIYHLTATPVSGCNNYITARSHGAYPTEALGSKICLLCLFNGTNKLSNVVDSNDDNYATAFQIASILGEKPVAAFQWNEVIEPAKGEKLRTGFIVQANSKLLDLTALTHYKIRLYHGNQLVSEDPAVDKSNIKLGLLGFNQDKIQLSVETERPFDRIELWDKGVAGVLPSIRLHNIFYEPVSCHDADGAGGCMELMTNLKDNLQVDYKGTKIGGLLVVGKSLTDLDLIYDGSTRTGTEMNNLLGLANGTDISLTFDTKKANQTIGIILKGADGLLNAGLLKGAKLTVYKDDTKLTHELNMDLLGANALSEGGYHYIEVTPDKDFNRIVFHTGTVLDANLTLLGKSTLFCGVYLRPDKDSDGIPDCADTETVTSQITFENDTHACVGNDLQIKVEKAPADLPRVHVYCWNEDLKTEYNREATLANNTMTLAAEAHLPVGRYLLYVYSEEGKLLTADLKATIHPLVSTWKQQPQSTNWNIWENWEEGSPWACTNVILPSEATTYPQLTEEAHCSNIHFEHGAELLGAEFLHYVKASVDLNLQGGRTYLLSAPLQGMVTGDFFLAPGAQWNRNKYFTPLDKDNYPESRNKPIVYQHVWNCEALEYDDKGQSTDVGKKGGWSADFNSVDTHYTPGQGFLVRAGGATDHNRYTFRFPKEYTEYHYYDSKGNLRTQTATVTRGKQSTSLFTPNSLHPVTLHNTKQASATFVMGNPFMAHLRVADLLNNNHGIKAIRVVKNGIFDPTKDVESQTEEYTQGTTRLIKPMEGFFVIAQQPSNALTVKLTPVMLTQRSQATRHRSHLKRK
mgnify:CR=1 FL=1